MENGLETIQSGIPGLDEVLHGGFVPGRLYLVAGEPGTGKTLLGMEFLREGLEAGDTVLFIHGEESREDLVANAAELSIDLDGVEFLDLGPDSEFFTEELSYDLVNPQDVEPDRVIEDIREKIEEINPDRVVLDPITQLDYIESTDYQVRKRLISFMRFLKDRGTTVLATKTRQPGDEADELRSLSDGIIELQRGTGGRRLAVPKHRGIGQRDGSHGMEIRRNGIEVYPSLIPKHHERDFSVEQMSTGVDELDQLLGGGIERGTVTFITGPTGVGKTTTGTHVLSEAAEQGDRSILYLFEESPETFVHRSESLGLPVRKLRDEGLLELEMVEPLALSAEEFARMVQSQVEERDVDLVMIDGLDGYRVSIQGDDAALTRKLHAVARYLKNMNVSVLIIDETERVTGIPRATSANVSYIADNILLLNYFEIGGELRKVVGVLKKRVGDFEHKLREFKIMPHGIEIGEQLTGVSGILQGAPRWGGDELLDGEWDD